MTVKKKTYMPPETRYFGAEAFELLPANTDEGCKTKPQADKIAREWKAYPADGKARVVKGPNGRWYVYGV